MAAVIDSSLLPTTDREKTPNLAMRSDRLVGGLLLTFFLALYLISGGGHGYSPDGEFAYQMGRSLTVDPQHEYLVHNNRMLSQWGIMIPLLSQPLIVLGDRLAEVMPQKDHAMVDGRDYKLGIYRQSQPAGDGPTVGAIGPGVEREYTREDLGIGPGTSLALMSFLALSTGVPQGTEMAEITLTDGSGTTLTFPIRAGIETSEWSRGMRSPPVQHDMIRVASIWSGNLAGRNYFVELPFGRSMDLESLQIRYVASEGNLYVRSLALLNQGTDQVQLIPSEWGLWSPRENDDFFARFFYSFYNAIVTAVGCVLLFALVRLFGYGQVVSLAAALVYGLATMAWPYAKYDFSEPTLVLFVLTTLYLVFRWDRDRRERWMLLAGLSVLASVATKYFAGVLVPLMLLEVLLLQWEEHPSLGELRKAVRPAALFCAPFVLVAVPAVWYLGRRYGYDPSILKAWAGVQHGWLALPMSIGLGGLLFSPGRSFFLYSPPVTLVLFSVVPFVRRHGLRTLGLLAIVLVYFLIYSKKAAWYAGDGWGPRYQVVVIPLVILATAPLIQKAVEGRSRWARHALALTFALGVAVQLLAVSKAFENYLDMFRHEIVTQLPDKGARYGGGDFYPYAEGLVDHNSMTATVMAWPFSPILAHAWLLSADALNMGPAFLQPLEDRVLATPPWKKFWGIDVLPAHPEYGLGLDFWSVLLRTNFPSSTGLLAGAFVVLLLLEVALVVSGARITSVLLERSGRRQKAGRVWIVSSTLVLLLFDGAHLLL